MFGGLDRFTLYPDWELIVVDNASQDGTVAYLSEYAATRPWVRVVANKENLGFSRGNNVGLREANGEYLVMLNNDTYVTQGWLVDLIRHLRKNANLGLVGPVTNNIGNEAKIDISYSNMNEMEEEARRYTMMRRWEKLLYVDTIAFFCVAFSQKLYREIGPLDELFETGFFEDDDYCDAYGWPVTKLRLLKMSSSIIICRQVSMLLARNANGKSLKKAGVSTRQNGDHGARTNTELTRTRPVGPVRHLPRLSNEPVSGITAMVDGIAVGFECAIEEPVVAHELTIRILSEF